jgi:hypothetical protein
MRKKVTVFKGPNRGSKIFFEVCSILDGKKFLGTPRKSVKQAKNHILKGPNRRLKIFFYNFFLYGGILGTHKRSCAKFAPFWM